jgi:subtilisin family serine protease
VTEPSDSRLGCGQWLVLLALAVWLAIVPLAVVALLSFLNGSPPELLVQLGLVAPGSPVLPSRALGLLATLLTLGLHLLFFLPSYLATKRPGREFLHTSATLLIAISLFQALNALARLPWPENLTVTATLRLVLVLPFLLLGLATLEIRRRGGPLTAAWRRVGLRMWLDPSPMWLALGIGAIIVWPWVLVGSLGSTGTTAANAIQALPNACNEEILFRGFAFAWLWRGTRNRTRGAVASLILFVAAQGGTVLPGGDWAAPLRLAAALMLGLLATELTVWAAGSIWPALVVHFLYDWVALAFVDPRSREELLHWLVRDWVPLVVGLLGLVLWLARRLIRAVGQPRSPTDTGNPSRSGQILVAVSAGIAWTVAVVLYVTMGVPGFHPDGFLIILDEQADLGPAAHISDSGERRVWVYDTLVETAERSQALLRAELDRRGLTYRPHYLINMVEVQGRPGARRTLAKWPGVASVQFQPGMRRYPRTFVIPGIDISGPQGVDWNVREVGADLLWDLGYAGQGVIVGGADSGVSWHHPALESSYLGWENEVQDHDYHWYDAWDGRAEPWDDNGHGTHTIGTVVGQDGENQIGLAPGARWIACRNMRHGLGNPGSYLSCMEFLLAPHPLDGDPFYDGDPARGAHVVNNSWGCPDEEGCLPDTLRIAVENLRAAGQMMVVSAGNDGPACGTVEDPPAIYDAVFTVGAIERGDQVAGFSSRGPVTIDGSQRPKPDLVAPGVDIRSAVPGGYAPLPGTSMAGPHVAGAVALLWSVDPSLIGDVERTEAILAGTAQQLTVDGACPDGEPQDGTVCACGDDEPGSIPNQVYGWGQVDVWAAAQTLLEGR